MKTDAFKCWTCGAPIHGQKISFRSTCDQCLAWQHCCKNCKNYQPGRSNDCLIPGTDPISDREACNYCEEFAVKGTGPSTPSPVSDLTHRLFGEEIKKQEKKFKDPFDSLFKEKE